MAVEIKLTASNVLKVYRKATAEEIQHGLTWYVKAHGQAAEMADEYGVSIATAAGVIAALSPNNQWERNLLDARTVLSLVSQGQDGHNAIVCTYSSNLDKAVRIAEGLAPLDVLGGLKVRAFYSLIANPDADEVCIDGHAFNIARQELSALEQVPSITAKRYREAADCYRVAARKAGVKPSQMQAITWVAWRRLNNTFMKLTLTKSGQTVRTAAAA